MQGVCILGLGKPAKDKGARITGGKVFDFIDPLNELSPLLVIGFLGRILRRHVVYLYVGGGLLEVQGG